VPNRLEIQCCDRCREPTTSPNRTDGLLACSEVACDLAQTDVALRVPLSSVDGADPTKSLNAQEIGRGSGRDGVRWHINRRLDEAGIPGPLGALAGRAAADSPFHYR
jgi:hypothetical protein